MGYFIIIIVFLLIFLFIYFGYYQDYKRNPKEFKRTIIGMPFGLLASFQGFEKLNEKLKNWANNSDTKNKKDKNKN